MKCKIARVILLGSTLCSIVACTPEKNEAYFKAHPEAVQIEGKRCLELKQKNQSIDDERCSNVALIEFNRCMHQQAVMGGHSIVPVDCKDTLTLYMLAAQGY